MKVLWINDKADFTGGAETYIYQSVQALSKRFDIENILLYSVNSRINYEYSKVFSFATVLADLRHQVSLIKPDIIYVHQVDDLEVLKELSQIDIPVIGFIHDHKYFCLREHKYTALTHKTCTKKVGLDCYSCLGFINRKSTFPYISINSVSNIKGVQNAFQRFEHIVVASDYMKEHLSLHGFKDEKVSKITLFSKPANNLELNNTPATVKRFLFVGQLVRGKGVDTLLHAFARLKTQEVFLDICGDGRQRRELEEITNNLGISKQVTFHGKVAPNELSNYYINAYAVIIPSRAPETFNLVGLEAMKHSKAVVATDVGGIKEWLKDGKNGFLFPSNNDSALSSILDSAVKSPDLIREMGKQGFEDYHKRFMPEMHCNTLYNLFETLLIKESYAT